LFLTAVFIHRGFILRLSSQVARRIKNQTLLKTK